MSGIGVCSIDDIALSVLTTAIGHQRNKDWIIVDAGWMAMSRDQGTAKQAVDHGYGAICNQYGIPYKDLIMVAANQEHDLLFLREGSTVTLPELPVGTLLRILPNHACATASQFDCYHVIGTGQQSIVKWARFNRW
jgi:D-serine deaminase-like pyridoxal phosphate-dependent protein